MQSNTNAAKIDGYKYADTARSCAHSYLLPVVMASLEKEMRDKGAGLRLLVEHVYAPRDYARSAFNLLKPGGLALISTPYNGYLKNLAIAACDGFDRHVSPLWDHGHIKFWSVKTLTALLTEAGFSDISFAFAGCISWLAKSMVAIARRPAG